MGEKSNEISSETAGADGNGMDVDQPQKPVVIPDGAIDLTPEKNGGVFKFVKRVGQGDGHAQTGDTVNVHYVGTLTDGSKFDSSRDRAEQFSFNLGRSQVIKGWDLAVATMKRGELADIFVAPEYGYGEAGSPPRIPSDATLIFEIELLSWEGEDISPDHDKTILRSVQKEGDKFEYPNDGAKITAHIRGLHDGREFRNDDVQFILGEGIEHGLPEGVDRALKRFRRGEISVIHLKPRWGFGKNGYQQYAIPAVASLDFEICLKEFEKAKDSWQMNDDEKLDEAEKLKQRGTDFFQRGKNKLAASKYKRILDLLQHETHLEGEKKVKRDSLYSAAHNNLAMVFLKTNETVEAIKHCDKVLELDPINVKALYRRGQAYQAQNDYEDAVTNYERMLELEPDNKAAQANILKCKAGIADQHKRQKVVFANMFEKLSKDSPQSQPQPQSVAKSDDNGTTK